MGAAASATNGMENQCTLGEEEVNEFSAMTHFSEQEVRALHIHYNSISASHRDDGLIDRTEFQTALGYNLNECFYVDRIFELFDMNQDGFISFKEFILNVSVFSTKGTKEEKVAFSFKILDLKGDDKLDEEELRQMLKACVSEHKINMKSEHIDQLLSKTFYEVDLDKDGFIDLTEYRTLIENNSDLLSPMSINISGLIVELGLAAVAE